MTLHAHFDSVPDRAADLPRLDAHARHQEAKALQWFRAHPSRSFSRQELEAAMGLPTQSVSRILSNLTARFAIEKSGEKVLSSFGRRSNCWRLVRPKAAPVEQGRLL